MRRVSVFGASAALVLASCVDTRDEDASTAAIPTSASASTTGLDSSGSSSSNVSSSSDAEPPTTGAPRLDVGADSATEGMDPDGPMLCEDNVDIVFVMDVSTTMGPFLDQLADEILAVDEALAALDLPAPPHYGLVVFVDDVALLGSGAPYPDVQSLRSDFVMWSDFTSSNQQTSGSGSNTTWPENSLDAMWAAANGFQWRSSANTTKLIIHTTDDTFWEGPATANGVGIQHDYASTVDLLQDEQVRVFSFTALIGGSCECEDVSPGWSAPYEGAPAIPEATDGGVFDIDEILGGTVSLADAIESAIDQSICEPYEPVG